MDDAYQELLEERIRQLKKAGVKPCEIHGWESMNPNGTCETCKKEDFPDDWRGTE
jgi:hypothetical protein